MARREYDRFRGRGQGQAPEVPWKLIRNGAIAVVLLVAVGGSLVTTVYEVGTEEVGIVKRFGAFVPPPQPPGLHFKLPFFIDRVHLVKVDRVQTLAFGFRTTGVSAEGRTQYREVPSESLMLTGDQNVVDVEWVVQYKIGDPAAWLFRIKAPESTIRDVSEATMRLVVGDSSATEVLTARRREIQENVKARLQKTLDSYGAGVHVAAVELQNVVPPTKAVEDAFNEVNRAQQEKQRTILEANKAYQKAIPEAQGEARRVVQEAEGYRLKRVNEAHGDVAKFRKLLEEYERSKAVTRSRLYLEAFEEVLPNLTHIYVLDQDQEAPLKVLDLKEPAAAARRRSASAPPSAPASTGGGRR